MAATGRAARLAAAVKRPLPLPYHPLYRFYEGGSRQGLQGPNASRRQAGPGPRI